MTASKGINKTTFIHICYGRKCFYILDYDFSKCARYTYILLLHPVTKLISQSAVRTKIDITLGQPILSHTIFYTLININIHDIYLT